MNKGTSAFFNPVETDKKNIGHRAPNKDMMSQSHDDYT